MVRKNPLTEAVKSVQVSRLRDVHNETWVNHPLLTLKQAARYAICTPRYLQKQIRSGRLKALKPTGKLLRIRRCDLEKFLESGATIAGEPVIPWPLFDLKEGPPGEGGESGSTDATPLSHGLPTNGCGTR